VIQVHQASLQPVEVSFNLTHEEVFQGVIIACAIIGLWTISLAFLLCLDLSKVHVLSILPAMLWQTFLYTGLFITAHDAMHGGVYANNPKINNLIGSICLFFYALFSYQKLLRKHWFHHKYPASKLDPDFHDGENKNFFGWYFHFMRGYSNWKQLLGLACVFIFMNLALKISAIHLILFWTIPAILSSVQLFYFGTFLTHREPEGGYTNAHRTQSSPLPVFWSFITCYHFGYHEEHHNYPRLPWWKLPEVYQQSAKTLTQ
jgi:beta-carotene/zeaxanthin 4-ketolase